MARVVDLNERDLRMLMEQAASLGRNGDTRLVHVNAAEEKMLKEAGGAGTKNPKTGLKEYYDPDAPGFGGFSGSGGKGTGGDPSYGGGGSKSSNIGGDTRAEAIADKRASSANAQATAAGGNSKGTGGAITPKSITSDVTASFAQANKAAAQADYNNEDNSFIDKIGNFLAGLVGVGEMNPADEPLGNFMSTDTAQWGVDPISAALGAASLVNPAAALLSKGYTIGKKLAGVEGPMIGFGHTNFGGAASPESVSTASASKSSTGGAKSSDGQGDRESGLNGDKRTRDVVRGPGRTPTAPVASSSGGTSQTPVLPPKSPADVLLEKYKLPGINAPFSLTPYKIDQTQHQMLVAQALQGRQ